MRSLNYGSCKCGSLIGTVRAGFPILYGNTFFLRRWEMGVIFNIYLEFEKEGGASEITEKTSSKNL